MLRKALTSITKLKFLLPSVLICLTPVFGWSVWKGLTLLRQERVRSLHDRLDEQSLLLGTEVKTELERLVQRMTELGEGNGGGTKSLSEADWGILSFSVWARGKPGAPPERKVFLTQDRALTPDQDISLKSEAERQLQMRMVAPAFEGKSLLVSDPSMDPRSIAVLIVPLGGPAKITRVALGHVRLAGIQRAFSLKLSSESFLVNSDGLILAHSRARRIGRQEPELVKGVFNGPAAKTGARGPAWSRFEDEKKLPRAAVSRMIQVGGVAVVSDVPASKLAWSRKEIFAMRGLSCLGLVLLAWSVSWIAGWGGSGPSTRKEPKDKLGKEDPGEAAVAIRALEGTQGEGMEQGHPEDDAMTVSSIQGPMDGTEAKGERPPTATQPDDAVSAGWKEGVKEPVTEAGSPPEHKRVAVLHGAIWLHDGILMELPPEDAALVLNDFFLIGQQVVCMIGGTFEKVSGNAFSASWAASGREHSEARTLLKCALALREEFRRFNEARKVDGYRQLTFVMGADWDIALLVKVTAGRRQEATVVGDPVAHARALSQLAVSVGSDLLVSQDLWSMTDGTFVGRHAADANLSLMSGLRACFTVQGFRNHEGKTVLVELPQIERREGRGEPRLQEIIPPEARWMVNTGSSILGPLTAAEVAQRLYALDLDFDSECWIEGKGKRLPLFKSGIFGGSEESHSAYWVFDGKIIHGPMSEGFLKTALQHGAVSASALVCYGTTVNGWKKASDLGWPESQIPDPRPSSAPVVLTSVETSATRIIEGPEDLSASVAEPPALEAVEAASVAEPPPFEPAEEASAVEPPAFQPADAASAAEPPAFHPDSFDESAEERTRVIEPPLLIREGDENPEDTRSEPPVFNPESGDDQDLAARIAASVVLEAKTVSKAS